MWILSLKPSNNLMKYVLNCPHFIDEKTEGQELRTLPKQIRLLRFQAWVTGSIYLAIIRNKEDHLKDYNEVDFRYAVLKSTCRIRFLKRIILCSFIPLASNPPLTQPLEFWPALFLLTSLKFWQPNTASYYAHSCSLLLSLSICNIIPDNSLA